MPNSGLGKKNLAKWFVVGAITEASGDYGYDFPPASIRRMTSPRKPEYRLTVSIPALRRYWRCIELVEISL